MVYRSNSSTHINSNDINNVLPLPTVNHKSSSFTNLTLPPPPATDYDPGKQARRSVRRLSIDIERLRLKKDMTTVCTTRRRNSVCRSASDLSSKSGLYDDLKSLKTQRNECVQKHKSDKIAVPCTTMSRQQSIAQTNERHAGSVAKFPSWLNEGLEPELELEDKNVKRLQISVPLHKLPVKTVDFLLAMKNNQTIDKQKILCLYCDRTFSSQTLYAKHSERVHQAPEGRRLSARKTNSSSLLYPGCSHCHNGKTTSLLNEELPALFHHLIDFHFDKYFACKPCTVRFPSKDALQYHLDQLHRDTANKVSTDKRKKRIDRRVPDNVPANLSQPLTIQVDLAESFDDKKDDEEKSSSDEPILRSSRRQNANRSDSTKTSNPRKARLLRNEETILSRLGITQNRSPRTRRGLKARAEVIRAETPVIRPTRNKTTRSTNNSSGVMVEGIEMVTRSSAVTKIESLSSTFDENFYESVSGNVRQNLSCHLDGKMQSGPMSPSPISPVGPCPTVRSTLVRSPLVADSEIHEATAISALTAFPTLLTASQYGAEPMPLGKIKKPITKNSWKWKWDCVKKYKYVNEGGKVVKKVKQPVAGIRDLSKLDMWTQLTMRTKHEVVRKRELEVSGEEQCLAVGEAAREDKRKLITQLNKILDTRILPQINLEQNDQRVVKLEVEDTNTETDQIESKPDVEQPNDDLLTILQIAKKPVPASANEEERVLSGEWARPRCYICYGCGEKFENIRRLEDHKNTCHPHVYSTHYEIVGKELIEGDLIRHFYIPTTALRGHSERLHLDRKSNVEVEDSMDSVASFSISCSKSDSFDMDSNSRNSKVSAISIGTSSVGNVDESSTNDVSTELKKTCTKCKRSYNTLSELYRHMLDCSGDYDWFLAKKRHNIKYRYFGSRRRKINRTNFGNRRPIRPKKEENDTPRIRDTQTPKQRPSDAESIQRMLENLPAKRVCRQIFPNLQAKKRARKFMPVNALTRSRQQMHLKSANAKTNRNFKFISTTQTTVNAIRKNISRRLRYFAANNTNEMVRSTRSARTLTPKQPSNDATTEIALKGHGIVRNITRRTQRLFPKLTNTFRRPLQKRNVRNDAAAGDTVVESDATSSIMDRMRKSKRVQVTIKKLDENIVDLVTFDDSKTTDDQRVVAESADVKAAVKKRTINRLIKSIRAKRTGNKNTIDVDDEAEVNKVETPSPEVKIEIEEHFDVKESPVQIDETSQSSSRSGSSRKSKRNAMKKQKSIESITAEATIQSENVIVIAGPSETKISEMIDIQPLSVVTETLSEEPIDLSQSKCQLTVPVVQEPIKTPPMKRRTRKLNDCIAMLTGKLQEKLGVPFINSEATILLSPSKSEASDIEKKDGDNQGDNVAKPPQKSSKEPASSHSTPTKRGSRSPKTKDTRTNVAVAVMKPENKIVDDIQLIDVQENVVIAPDDLKIPEVTPSTIIETASSNCAKETVVDITESLSPSISDDVLPLDATDASKSKDSDEIQPKTLDEAQMKDDKTTVKTTSDDATTDIIVKTPKRKETKKKISLDVIVAEPPVMDDPTVAKVLKTRQTKKSTAQKLEESTNDDKSLTVAGSSCDDSTSEGKNIPEEKDTVTGKQNPIKGKSGKSKLKQLDNSNTKTIRRNSLTVTNSLIEVEPLTKTQENDKKPMDDVDKKVTKSKKSKKKSVLTETKLLKVVTPSPLNEKSNTKNSDSADDEMHPWDPEIGFITANNPEPAFAPVTESRSLPDLIDNRQHEPSSSSCNESPKIEIIPTTVKVTDDKLGTKKKRRKNELAKIIADQLLESFKEVDKSRIEELKLLHDLSIESNDDLLLSTTMSRTPPPKRRTAANMRNEAIVTDAKTVNEDVNSNENVEKIPSKRKKPIESKKSLQTTKIGKKPKKIVPTKSSNKKDSKKKASDPVSSSGHLSDTEISQPKKPVIMRRRLTICDESPKRMSRNSKETEVAVSLFDSFKKRKNIREVSTKQTPKETKIKSPPSKVQKQKNKRNLMQQSTNDSTKIATIDDKPVDVVVVAEKTPPKSASDKCDDSGKSTANVNDLVTQIINDFTTSTLNSPTTSPILFGDLSKPRLNNAAATKLSSVLSNKKNILNGETLTNGFKSDVSKEITFATLSQPLKDKSLEDAESSSSADAKQPFRAPFMSPRWDPADDWNGTTKPIKDPALHKLWTLNNKDEQLTGEKSLYQCVKEKTKKFLGKISRKKTRSKHDGTLNNKKSTTTVVGIKKPLLRPSILSVSNHTSSAKVDAIESENVLKKLESNRLFLGKISNFENDSISKIFRNDKLTDKSNDPAENELFSKRSGDTDATIMSNLKSNVEKEDWKMEKKFQGKVVAKSKNLKNDSKPEPKRNVKKPKLVVTSDVKTTVPVADASKDDNVDKTTNRRTVKQRKMGSTRRQTGSKIAIKNASEDMNEAFCSQLIEPSTVKQPDVKSSATKSFDESSQDTIISEIVNKIRDSNNGHLSESDEDLSLAEIAKNLNNKTNNCDEFSNDGVTVPVALTESFVSESSKFGTLAAVLDDQLDTKDDGEKTEDRTNCDDDIDDDGDFVHDTNTDLIDMDLEDTASVYTSSMETTVTSSGGSQKRRKRRHGRSILMKPSRKSKRGDSSFLTPGESFYCDLCSKTFRTQGGLATHRTTLTHISKLSEQEFKQKMETPTEDVSKPVAEEDIATKPDLTKSPVIESSSQPNVPLNHSPLSNQRNLPITSPARSQSLTYLNNIEPISSPEHQDFNYDRYSRNLQSRNNDSSRIALSQEQRFFYECCSMLKGSDRSNVNPSDSPNKYYTLPERSEIITKPVTPRSNEQYSYVVPEGSKHSKGIPKIDLNQFSDISEDSNPAFSCPQNPSSSETQNIFPIESKRIVDKRDHHASNRNFDLIKKAGRTFNDTTTTTHLETFSDMGDSFPSSQDVSECEQYTQTILERSSNSVGLIRGGYHDSGSAKYDGNKQRRNVFTIAMESSGTKGFPNSSPVESPLHSTSSSQSSTLSKPRTKAAMKGYDNFKISIPTTGIDLQQALNRSPNASGCKLAALADIALRNDVPNVVALIRSHSDIEVEHPSNTPLDDTPIEESVPDVSVHEQQATKTTTMNKAGSSCSRKKKLVSPKTPKKPNKTNVKVSPKSTPRNQPKDVYDFEDFEDSTDAPILTLSQVRSKPLPPSANVDDGDDSETSSYSDRLDYNYESMSESDTSVDNLQKKCLIERIFKSVKKTDAKEKEKIEPKKPPLPKQELDKLFDGLRQSDKNVKTIDDKKATDRASFSTTNKPIDEKHKNERSRDRQSKKSREIANLEEEWGMSMNQIVELIGVGQRKTQRRCAANKQKTFAENWSSDEYEDFHATKDIFALIHEAEMKAGRARSRTARSNAKRERQLVNEKMEQTDEGTGNAKAKTAKDKENKATADDEKDDDTADVSVEKLEINRKSEPSRRSHSKSTDSKVSSKKPAKVKGSKSFVATESDDDNAHDKAFDLKKNSSNTTITTPSKIKNRRQTISSRHDLHKAASKAAISNGGARVKQNRSVDSRIVDFKTDGKMKMKTKPMARRKRKASEMLYYWSSSSDEDFGRIKPRDDNFEDDNLEQHGWIVGDSHKKLVTLLAHAKGKKVEDCAVKKAIHKKKS